MTNSFPYMKKLTLLILLSILSHSFACNCGSDSTGINLTPADNYPRWLKNDDYHTSQTSGITRIKESDDGTQQFLLADDIGKIHRFFINEDTVFSFSEIKFGTEATDYLADFPKLDFEEIFFDKYTGNVYLSIEGNEENHLAFHGIYRLKFFDDDICEDSVIALEKLDFEPKETFFENLRWNIGYEGFTADENFFYLGLENVQTPDGEFTDSTVIRIADKATFKIVKEISTSVLGIATICGLYSDENYSLWGIDRNQRKVFKLKFDEYFNISEISFIEIKTVVPGYNNFEYVGSLESITMGSGNSLFLVDDPWHTYFIPTDEILNQLDNSTINNFNNFIPVIYKFDID